MSLICGDVHGNKYKAKNFLEYKPTEEHVFVGDYMDSFIANEKEMLETYEMIMTSGAITLAGNHELHYLPNTHQYMKCSGFVDSIERVKMVTKYLDKLQASYVVDDFFISHGGLSKYHGKVFDDIHQANAWCNTEFEWYKNTPVIPETLSKIFDVGSVRGGLEPVGGIFWFTVGFEEMDNRFNQICGHTPQSEPKVKQKDTMDGNKLQVYIDFPQFMCYNTTTNKFEDFMPEQYRNDDQMRKMIERKF